MKKFRILFFLIVFSLTLPLTQQVSADTGEDVKKLVKEKIDKVIELLRRKDIDKKIRNEKLIDTVNPIFDFKRMAMLSLGKKHWVSQNKVKQGQFSKLFVKRLQESYLEKLDLYTDEDVTVDEAVKVKKRIHILTHLVTKEDKKEMIYKFYKSKKGWKVYDVEILGVSIVQTYRSQFQGILKTKTFDELLEKLKLTGEFTIPTGENEKN